MSRTQIAALTEQRGRDLKDIEYLNQESERNAEQKKRFEEESGSIAASLAAQNTVLLEKTVAFENLAQALKDKEAALEAARAGVYTAMTESAAEKTRIANIESRIQHLDEQDQAAAGRIKRTGKEAGRPQGAPRPEGTRRSAQTASRRAALQEEHAASPRGSPRPWPGRKRWTRSSARRRTASPPRIPASTPSSSWSRASMDIRKASRPSWRRKKQSASERVGTIHGLVADIIETEPKYETAIEAVLGDRLQNVVVGSQNDSLKAIEYLKSSSGGRSTFIPESPREIPDRTLREERPRRRHRHRPGRRQVQGRLQERGPVPPGRRGRRGHHGHGALPLSQERHP